MTEYVSKKEWLKGIAAIQEWWRVFACGLEDLEPDLEVRFTKTGFVSIKFHGVGISNTWAPPGRSVVSIGYEQEHTTARDAQELRRALIDVISNWIDEQQWGHATDGADSRYRELTIDDNSIAPAKLITAIRDLLDRMESKLAAAPRAK